MNSNNDKELGDLLDINAVSEQTRKICFKTHLFQVKSRTRFPNSTIETSRHQAVPVRSSIFFIIMQFFIILFRFYIQQSLTQLLHRFHPLKQFIVAQIKVGFDN